MEQLDSETKTIAWWYEQDGKQLGPVNEDEIKGLVESGKLKPSNMVWKEGLQTWVEIKSSDFSTAIPVRTGVPPPLTGDAVNNKLVWWLAFAPLLGLTIQAILLELTNPRPGSNASFEQIIRYASNADFDKYWFVTIALNLALSYADEKNLKKAGHDTEKLGGAWLVPAYLYKRAEMLNQKNTYFWIWIVSFVLTLM
jgi:hypothetical protein